MHGPQRHWLPQVVAVLERDIITLRLEYEALKREKDKRSRERVSVLELELAVKEKGPGCCAVVLMC